MENVASKGPADKRDPGDFPISRTPHPKWAEYQPKLAQGKPSPDNDNRPQTHFKIRPFTEVEKRQPQWVWHQYLERGVVNSITADPDAGKSTIVAEIAAALSVGRPLPGEDGPRKAERVWILSSEDRADTVMAWRLENQGFDPANVLVTDEKAPLSTTGLRIMEKEIVEKTIALVVIDTITTWLDELDTNSSTEAAQFINGLKGIAQRTNCTFLVVRHNRKSGGSNKLHVGMGTIAITAAVRCELMASVFKGVRYLEKTKGNVGRKPPKLFYEIADGPDPQNPHGVLKWTGSVTNSGPGAVTSRTPLKLGACKEWLEERLAEGPVNLADLRKEGTGKDFSEATMKRAKKDLGITSTQIAPQEWVWALPGGVTSSDESVTQG